MKIYSWKGKNGVTNFGDELNSYIWPRLIPNVFTPNSDYLFVGIGSVLNSSLPQAKGVVVFGAGVGYGPLPQNYSKWKIYCLRGPYSASMLKVNENLAITDPAVLIRKLWIKKSIENRTRFGYMPHWINANPVLECCCSRLDIKYISPLREPESILKEIEGVDCLISEALHGAIIADSLRIPWIATADSSNPDTFPLKWFEWCTSVNLHYKPARAPISFSHYSHETNHFATSILKTEKTIIKNLEIICKNEIPILSKSSVLDKLCERYEERIDLFKTDVNSGKFDI